MRRFSRRFGGSRGKRRHTVWIPGAGFSNADTDLKQTVIMNATVAPTTPGFFVYLVLTLNSDLLEAGGEEAVVVRTLGKMLFANALNSAGGASPQFLRMALILRETPPESANLSPLVVDLFDSPSLGNEDILWTDDVFVSSATMINAASASITVFPQMTQFDVKAKRKLAQQRQLCMLFQSATSGATNLKQFDVHGYIRTLLRAPAR